MMAPNVPRAGRSVALDAFKGLIMILMALDHVAGFLVKYDGTKEVWYLPAAHSEFWNDYAARFAAHIVAPGFFFLLGVGMVLLTQSREARGWDASRIRRSFWVRGAVLIVLQFTLVNLAWFERSSGWHKFAYTGVISTLGATMILASFTTAWPSRRLFAAALGLLLAPGFVIPFLDPALRDGVQPVVVFLVSAGRLDLLRVNYPLLPWLGVVLLGIIYGRWWKSDRESAKRMALWGGIAMVSGALVLRALPGPWTLREPIDGTILSYLQMTKYPPSVVFVAFNLGLSLVLLGLLARVERAIERWAPFLISFGGSALFFYVAHMHLYAITGRMISDRYEHISLVPTLVWIGGLLLLWPACRWYAAFKGRQPADSIWRLF